MLTKDFSDEFTSFLEQYFGFYAEFLDVEKRKYQAIVKNDIKSLDRFVTEEQALLLKSRGLEAQRDRLMAENGNESITLRDFIPLLDESYHAKAGLIYTKLSDSLLDLKDINTRSNLLTELRLHKIDNEIKHLENQPELQKEYNNAAKTSNRSINTVSRRV